MRLFLGCMLAVALAISPALAGTNDSRTGGSGDAKASDAVSNSTAEAAAKPDASAEAATNDTELPEAAVAGSGFQQFCFERACFFCQRLRDGIREPARIIHI